MGLCSSFGEDDSMQRNRQIESALAKSSTAEKEVIKLLLLGAGECGKSTILKQMKVLHSNGFSQEEKTSMIGLIRNNTLESLQQLCRACVDLKIPLLPENVKRSAIVRKIRRFTLEPPGTDETLYEIIKHLLVDDGIQKAYERSNQFHLFDSALYFLNSIDRTLSSGYIPRTQDILRSRQATSGVIETAFDVDQLSFRMFDVGGQRGERKKWIHCFENVRSIFFVASLSEYDQMLAEDRTRNRLVESLMLFEGIIGLPWFKETPIILFLNKQDIFEEKIVMHDLGIYFPAYCGGLNYDEGLFFIKELYFAKNLNPKKTIFCHVTNATHTGNMRFVWKATKNIITRGNLTAAGLLPE